MVKNITQDDIKLKIKCLELAVATPGFQGCMIAMAKKYYSFIKEKDGTNVIDVVQKKPCIKLLSS